MRQEQKANVLAILAGSKGSLDAIRNLLELELAEALKELETAGDNIGIWRAQGRAQELRGLLEALNPSEGTSWMK